MAKIKIYDNEGRTRDERETCFPTMVKSMQNQIKNRGQVRNDR